MLEAAALARCPKFLYKWNFFGKYNYNTAGNYSSFEVIDVNIFR